MRLLHIIGSTDPSFGGPIEGITRQASVLETLGHQREIVSLDPPDAGYLAHLPIKVHALGTQGTTHDARQSRLPWRYYLYSPKLVPWFRENAAKFDAIIINGIWNYSAFAASRVLPGLGVPYFVFPHGMLDPWFRRAYPVKHMAKQLAWLVSEGPLLSNARSVFFTSEDERILARNQFWGYQYRERVVPYGAADVSGDPAQQIAAFHDAVPALDRRPFLLFLSRIHHKKGCDLLLSAFKSIAASYPRLDLVMAGPDQMGLLSGLQRMASDLGISERVHWPGMLRGDTKTGAFRAAEAFVLPSHQENFGIVVAEAMACGKPVLITNKVNIWREIASAGAGLVCQDEAVAVAGMLRDFLTLGDAEKLRMGTAARTCYEARFDASKAAAGFIEIVQEMR